MLQGFFPFYAPLSFPPLASSRRSLRRVYPPTYVFPVPLCTCWSFLGDHNVTYLVFQLAAQSIFIAISTLASSHAPPLLPFFRFYRVSLTVFYLLVVLEILSHRPAFRFLLSAIFVPLPTQITDFKVSFVTCIIFGPIESTQPWPPPRSLFKCAPFIAVPLVRPFRSLRRPYAHVIFAKQPLKATAFTPTQQKNHTGPLIFLWGFLGFFPRSSLHCLSFLSSATSTFFLCRFRS